MRNPAVQSLGRSFVERVQAAPPESADALKREFAAFSQALDGPLREPFAAYVSEQLGGSPDTAWMGQLIQPSTPEPRDAVARARTTLTEIAGLNAKLHGEAKSGSYVGFSRNDEPVAPKDVLDALGKGDDVGLSVFKWSKLSGWKLAGATLLGGTWPVLEGVDLESIRKVHTAKADSPESFNQAWQDLQPLVRG